MSQEIIDEAMKAYLSTQSILIVDSVSSARVSLASQLVKFGCSRQKMTLVGTLEEARRELAKTKHKVIFSDFMIGNASGLDLIQDQKAEYEKDKIKDSFFVLVTGNVSQSTVARAAEEDVDSFVIKPYTFDTLKKSLASTIYLKLNPNEYQKLIEEGKDKMMAGDLSAATELFTKAKNLNPQPTLACFYLGQVEYMLKALQGATTNYEEGLSYNRIHYKCLIGLYELLYQEKKFSEAYDVVKKLAQYFPANPKRLATVLRLAIMTENYNDIEGFYRIFVKVDQRTDELIRYMCSALVVTGKYYLKQKVRKRALEVFENAAVSSAGRLNFLLYIVETLVQHKMPKEAEPFLKRLLSLAPESNEYAAADFLIASLNLPVKEAIFKGRTLLKNGIEFPCVYEALIALSARDGYIDSANELYEKACQRYPEKAQLFSVVKSATPPVSA